MNMRRPGTGIRLLTLALLPFWASSCFSKIIIESPVVPVVLAQIEKKDLKKKLRTMQPIREFVIPKDSSATKSALQSSSTPIHGAVFVINLDYRFFLFPLKGLDSKVYQDVE
jgi:hypothetical protein